MELTADKMERLMFVKHLLGEANKQKDYARPLSSSAILSIHDCIECFLQLCFEVTTGKAKTSSHNILDTYATEINKALEEEAPQINKAFIKRINDLRNQLKHATIFTDEKQIPNLYVETEIFLKDFTLQILGISFDKIGLIELIKDGEIREHLNEAKQSFEKGENQQCMWSIGKAFYILEQKLRKINHPKWGEMDLGQEKIADYLVKYTASYGGDRPDGLLRENLDEIGVDISKIHDDIRLIKLVLSLGVDIREYLYFKKCIPHVYKVTGAGGTRFFAPEEEHEREVEYDTKEVEYCLDFVTRIALEKL